MTAPVWVLIEETAPWAHPLQPVAWFIWQVTKKIEARNVQATAPCVYLPLESPIWFIQLK